MHDKAFKAVMPSEPIMALEEALAQFSGTEKWYRHFTGLIYTDGIRYLADKGGAYWLIDLVGSYQLQLARVPFQLWRVAVNEDNSALVRMCEDTGKPPIVEQRIPFTDFPMKQFEFYCVDGVMLLKSEY